MKPGMFNFARGLARPAVGAALLAAGACLPAPTLEQARLLGEAPDRVEERPDASPLSPAAPSADPASPAAVPTTHDPREALLLALLRSADADGDGVPDALDATAGADTDGDGIPNVADYDVDGDGVPNFADPDVDGDNIYNGFDLDIDGDGLIGDHDPDEDGDGLSDRWDLDVNADGAPDNEDPDPPADRLLDLVDRLRTGAITEADRNAIANEISSRMNSPEAAAALQAKLIDVIALGVNPARQAPPTTVPLGVNAIDNVYRQLVDAIQTARRAQPNPNAPLPPEKLGPALRDFLARTDGLIRLARTLPSLSLDELGGYVQRLADVFSPARLDEVTRQLGSYTDLGALGDPAAERMDFGQVLRGLTQLGSAFAADPVLDLLESVDRLRARAISSSDDSEEIDAKFERLLDRAIAIADQSDLPLSALEAVARVEQEDDSEPDDEAEDGSDDDDGASLP